MVDLRTNFSQELLKVANEPIRVLLYFWPRDIPTKSDEGVRGPIWRLTLHVGHSIPDHDDIFESESLLQMEEDSRFPPGLRCGAAVVESGVPTVVEVEQSVRIDIADGDVEHLRHWVNELMETARDEEDLRPARLQHSHRLPHSRGETDEPRLGDDGVDLLFRRFDQLKPIGKRLSKRQISAHRVSGHLFDFVPDAAEFGDLVESFILNDGGVDVEADGVRLAPRQHRALFVAQVRRHRRRATNPVCFRR